MTVRPPGSERPGEMQWRAIRLAVTATLFGALPSFLLAGLAAQALDDLDFTEARLGLAISAYHTVAALASAPAGRLVERIGSAKGIAFSAAIASSSMLGVGLVANSWGTLAVFLVLGGFGSALAHPSANLVLARRVDRTRQGLAFGMKQAAVPSTTFIGGMAVPVIGLTIGWRWAFVGAAVAALGFLVYSLARTPAQLRVRPEPRGPARAGAAATKRSLLALAGAATLGTAAGNALATFMVVAGIREGLPPGRAGLLFSLASLTGITVRVLAGWLADRRELPHVPMIMAMMALATSAFLLMALGPGVLVFMIGAVVGFGASWGWQGILMFAVVRRHATEPAAATGVVQGGIGAGGVLGPMTVGWVIENASYSMAWLTSAGLVFAALLLAVGVWWTDSRSAFASAHQ